MDDKERFAPLEELTANEKQAYDVALAKLLSSCRKAALEFVETYAYLSYSHYLKEKEGAKYGTDKGE